MDDTYYRDPMELFDPIENKNLYLKSVNKHSRSYVFRFDNNYGAHIICEPLSTFTVNLLIFKTDYLFDTIDTIGDIKAKSGLGFNRMVDILQSLKNLPDYIPPEYEPHKPVKSIHEQKQRKEFLKRLNSDITKRRNKEALYGRNN